MSEPDAIDIVEVDIHGWVEAAANNPVLYRDRQVAEVLLSAIGVAPTLSQTLVLKGGALMALGFSSLRLTTDVDFSAMAEPEGFEETMTSELNALLPKTAIQLGYLDLLCRVQSVKRMPRPLNFADHAFPALRVRIGSAMRNSSEARSLEAGMAPRVLEVEISFRDQVYDSQVLKLGKAGAAVLAFSLHELLAEKLRALIQQPIRNRFRRQDVYDISFLLERQALTDEDRAWIHRILLDKCATRNIYPTRTTFEDPEIRRRAETDWGTLALEVENLPDFEDCFIVVSRLYDDLPWTPPLTDPTSLSKSA